MKRDNNGILVSSIQTGDTKMTFAIRNNLMILVNDDLTAFGTANDFVKDDAEKLEVYTRAFHKAQHTGDIPSRASIAKDTAIQVWEAMNDTSSANQ